MVSKIELGEINVDVVRKEIKNIHLSVYPPMGRVRISAPFRMDLDTIRVYAISKLGWIKKQQQKMRDQERESPREYLDRESHTVWGKRYLLKVIEKEAAPTVDLKHNKMILQIRPETCDDRKQAVIEEWYREKLKEAIPPLIAKWEPLMSVKVERFFVQRMKTKWGSCNHCRIKGKRQGYGQNGEGFTGDCRCSAELCKSHRGIMAVDISLDLRGIGIKFCFDGCRIDAGNTAIGADRASRKQVGGIVKLRKIKPGGYGMLFKRRRQGHPEFFIKRLKRRF